VTVESAITAIVMANTCLQDTNQLLASLCGGALTRGPCSSSRAMAWYLGQPLRQATLAQLFCQNGGTWTGRMIQVPNTTTSTRSDQTKQQLSDVHLTAHHHECHLAPRNVPSLSTHRQPVDRLTCAAQLQPRPHGFT
jgi:hypothetical protein